MSPPASSCVYGLLASVALPSCIHRPTFITSVCAIIHHNVQVGTLFQVYQHNQVRELKASLFLATPIMTMCSILSPQVGTFFQVYQHNKWVARKKKEAEEAAAKQRAADAAAAAETAQQQAAVGAQR